MYLFIDYRLDVTVNGHLFFSDFDPSLSITRERYPVRDEIWGIYIT